MTKRKSFGKTDSRQQPKINQQSQSTDKQSRKRREKKKRLFSLLRYQVGVPATLSLILPSLLSQKVKADDDIQLSEDGATLKPDASSAELLEKQYKELHQAEVAEVKESKNEPVEKADSIGAKPSHHLVLHHYPLRTAVDHHLFHSPAAPNTQTDHFLSQAHGPETGSATEHINTPHSPETVYYKPEIHNQQVSAKEDGGQVSGQLVATDNNIGEKLIFSTTAHVDGFNLQKDGSYTLDPDVAGYQSLREGEIKTVVVPVTVTDQSGLATKAELVITLTGTNDAPKISGQVAGQLKEDVNVDSKGLMSVSGQVQVQDIDSGESHTLAEMIHGQFGTLTIDAQGHWHYQVNNNLTAIQQLTAKSHLEEVLTIHTADNTPQQIQIMISGTDDRPMISGIDQGKVIEDLHVNNGALETSGILSVTDVDLGQAHFIPQVISGLYGVLTLGTDGKWSYEANNQQGAIQSLGQGAGLTDTFTVSSADGATHQIHVEIEGTNDLPVMSGQSQSVKEDGAILKGQMHATDVDHDLLTYSIAHPVEGLTFNSDGSYSFNPSHASYQLLKDGEHKVIDIPVTATDEHGASITQNLTINIRGTADSAVIGGVDTGSVHENQAGQDKSPDYAQPGMAVIGQDTLTTSGQLTIVDPDSGESVFDPNGPVYSYSGQYGHLLLRPDGHWDYAVAAGTHDWHFGSAKTTVGSKIDQLGQGQTLTDTITIHSKDGTTHDIVITIHGDNDAPYVSSEVTLQSGKEDVSQTFTKAELMVNAVDVDSNDAGRLTVANLLADHGSVRDNHDGTYTFTPDRDYNGQVHFTYDVKDVHGGVTPTGASMQVTPVADAAQITAIGDSLKEDNVLSGTTELHSTGYFRVVDPDGAQESFFETTLAGRNAFYKGSLGGDLQVNKDGGYFYNIDNSLVDSLKNGETVTDQFTIRSADGTTKQVEFTIQGTSDKPYIGSGSLHECVFEDGGLLKGSLYGVDPDHGDQKHLVYTPVGSVPGFTMLPDGHYTFDSSHPAYQHASLSKGDEHIIIPVKVTDSEGLYSVQNLRITMIPTNDAPIVTGALSLSKGTEDQSVLLHSRDLLSNATDIDDYDRLHIANVRADHGRVTDNHDGTFTFIPDANYSGRVNFSYQVMDNHGASTPATAAMDLANVNDPAVFSGQDTGGITEDHHVQGDAQHTVFTTGVLNVVDPDSGEQHFHATHRAQAIHDPFGGTLTIGKAGDWAYSVPNANLQHLAQGQTEQVQYQVQSAGGDTHTITVTIRGTNDAPTLTAQTQAVTEDGQELAGKMQGNDTDQGAVLHYSIAQAVDGLTFNNDGSYRFDPSHSAYQHLSAGQTQTLTIPVSVTDEHHASVTENLIITITGTNDNPIVSPISDTVKEDSDTHHVVDLLQGATDPDGGPLSISHIQCQYHGATGPLPDGVTFSHDGTHVIVDATAQGFQHLSEREKEQITFHYLVTDPQGGTTSQTATITVVGSDDKANIASSSIELTEQQALKTYRDISSFMGRLSLVDPDSHDHTQFSFTLEQGSQNIGYLTVWPDGTYRYYADAARNHGSNYRIAALKTGETLTEHFQVKTSDGQTRDIAVTIHGSDNNAYLEVVDPRYLPAHQNIYEDRTSHSDPNQLYAGGIIRVRDPDHDDAFAVSHSETTPHGGHFFVNNGGSWSYTIDNHLDEVQNLAEGESFTESFTITSKDGTASKVVQVTVHGSNDRPVVTAAVTLPSGEEDKDMILTSQQLLANATDRDHGDLARLSIANLSANHGVIIDHHDGTFTFRPSAQYNGDVHFTYDVVDPHGASVHTGASSTLASVNDPSSLAPSLAHAIVTEDHTSGGRGNSLWSGWTNIDIQDPDSASDAAVVAIEVNGVRHNVPADFAMTLTANHGYFSTTHSTDGHNKWSYTADNADSDIQGLKSGEQLQDSMVLITRDGTRIPVTATINGQDDHVVIDTPNALTSPIGTVIEDSKTTVAGMLHAHDLDYGDTVSYELANSQPTQSGSYGTFYLDSSGAWHYDLDASKVQALGAGDGKAEGFDIVAISSDGSRATQRVEVFVQGTDDAATITGQSTGTITEDQQVQNDAAHTVCVSGVLNAQDADAGESGFQHTLNAHAINDPFGGSLSIGKTGGWTYSAPNANLQHLGQGETQQVQYEVQTLGGDKHVITIQVAGTNDGPVLHVSPITPITGTLTETDVDVGDTHQFGVSQSSGQYGTLSVDPDTGAYQYTPNGQIVGMHYNSVSGYTGQDTFEVSVTDKAGLTSSLFVTFDVTGTVTAPSGTGQRPTTSTLVSTQPTISQTMPTQMTASAQAINHVTVDLTTSSDTGQSDTDNLTSAQTPEISGHTDIPFSLVKIYDDSKVIGSGYSDDHGDYQIVVGALGDGVHNISARALAPSGVLPTVSSVMPVTIDTQAPTPSISIDSITSDNVINAVESQSSITITGSSTGGTQPGDVVTIEVGGHQFTGQLDASGRYSIDVPGGELVHAAMIKASVSATDSAGNTATAFADHHFDVDTSVSSPTITFEDPGPDNAYSKAEIAQGAAGTITATVHAAADAKVGEHININGVVHVLDANSLRHGIQLEVAPSTIVRAVMTDEHGNVSSNLNMAAGAKPEPIVVTAPSGSHQISASLGVPTLMPSQTPVPSAQQGWKILVNGHYHTSYTSQWGTLTIDPKTGHLSYQEHADVHTGPHGSAQNVGVHEDHFQIALQGSHQDDVLLHVQVSILNHGPGHSGKLTLGSEVLDMTVTPVTTNHPPPPPPPAPADFADEAMDVDEPVSANPLTIMTQLGLDASNEHHHPDEEPSQRVSSYLDKLGLENAPHSGASPSSDVLPDDIDIVLNDEVTESSSVEHRPDGHEGGLYDDSVASHEADSRDDQHHHDDPTLPDDSNP
ncbi:VCBS domain-containing protein [Vibrio hangzhouensis]|uniref:VCBS repeat-containing protein n=1 Tax=Vibrio hangzhouensis TaxID=462991 RepID=A0A1H5W4V4_9VIBR|nr:VCBS domain-containing protein [Vibrio hangzhouensis]SEF94539.1 VCBS repeat-containing protein [Vibrio hangzhouensis]